MNKLQNTVIVLFVSVVFLLPFGRLAEIPILLLSCIGIWLLLKNGHKLFHLQWCKTFSTAYLAYFLLISVSAIDSVWPEKSWLIGLASVRFYLMGLVLIHVVDADAMRKIAHWVTVILVLWALDAVIQGIIGHNLLGQASYPGRLTGVFGQNVKLGPVLALFLSLVMMHMCRYQAWLRWLVVALIVVVIVLSGTRSAWLMMAFVLMLFWWQHVQGRRWILMVKAGALIAVGVVTLWFTSTDFQQRVDRSLQLLQGNQAAIDFALADRLSIWQTALNMYQDHPINGVGARAFRKVYADYAEPNDVWVAQQTSGLHAHHWVLELLAETGSVGLLLMLWMLVVVIRYVRHSFNRSVVWPYGVALMAALLPVVSLYSLFSSFWSICLWWMLIMLFAGVRNESK